VISRMVVPFDMPSWWAYWTKLLRNFISFYHQAYHAAVWNSRHNILALAHF
jgi:hypothetical protein